MATKRVEAPPQHIAITMDGNGRWAQAKGLPRTAGHAEGVETVKRITTEAVRLGVKWLTLYTFSTENWNRPAEEVGALMGLILDHLEEEIFIKNNVRFRMIGQRDRLPEPVRQRIEECEERTKSHETMTMVIALSYSARWEMTQAIKEITAAGITDIDQEVISKHMQTSFMPDPDLMIRTGGELRLSNFLLWQAAYAELWFTPVLWPDFREEHLQQAISDYQQRQRRYGGVIQ